MAKDSFITFFVFTGLILGLILSSRLPNADFATYVGGAILGAVVCGIAGQIIWVGILVLLVAIMITLNVAGFYARHEITKAVTGSFSQDEHTSSDKIEVPAAVTLGAMRAHIDQ